MFVVMIIMAHEQKTRNGVTKRQKDLQNIACEIQIGFKKRSSQNSYSYNFVVLTSMYDIIVLQISVINSEIDISQKFIQLESLLMSRIYLHLSLD